ncbi:MAG TPA: hypothetical protein PKK60_04530 [archaeon]|nr:hypothetical protein [archaeon]
MVAFSDEQKKIALLLLNEPKTEEELNKQLNIPYDKLTVELKNMLKLGLISKEGYPTKYKLKQEIINEVQKRKKISESDAFKLRISAIIELKAIEENLLKKHSKKIMEAIKKEQNFTIYSMNEAEIVEEKDSEMFSTFIEVNMSLKDFPTLIRFLFYYGPTSVEVIKPTKVEFSNFEFQEGVMQLTDIFQKYANYLEKNINEKEMEKFYKHLYE